MTRYFKSIDGRCFWKFPEGGKPMIRMAHHAEWEESCFYGVDELLENNDCRPTETTEEEAEP